MSENKLTFLGTGTSTGIPIVGCPCQVCHSKDQKDKRLRSSVLIGPPTANFVIDTGPDLRTQLLRENVTKLDFAIITHEHADHLHGLDDLRPFTFLPTRRNFPVYSNVRYHEKIKTKFDYIFNRDKIFTKDNPYKGGGLPLLDLHSLDKLQSNGFRFLDLPHGRGMTSGIIHESMAHIIDCHEIPEDELSILENANLHTLIIDCLRLEKHSTHLSFSQSIEYINRIKPKKAYLTHIGHEVSHNQLQSMTESDVTPAYDGLKISYPKA